MIGTRNFINKMIAKRLIQILGIEDLYKHKDKKLRYDLVPWKALEKVVEVITEGSKEYGVDNWKSIDSSVFEAAMLRHFVSYKTGERYDKRWYFTHLAHLTCNALFLLWKELIVINIEEKNLLKGESNSIEALNEKKMVVNKCLKKNLK